MGVTVMASFSLCSAGSRRATAPLATSHAPLHLPSTLSFPLRPSSGKCSLNVERAFVEKKFGKISCSLLKVEDDVNGDACELVSGTEITIGEGDDSFSAYLFKAVKNNNGTGIIFLSDIFGFEDTSTRDFAYRVACIGYNVLVPDLFRGKPWTKDQPRATFEEWLARQEHKRIAEDIDASTQWMADEFLAVGISNKLGIIGFCFGGGKVVEVLSKDEKSYFGVGVSFYGTRMDQSLTSHIRVPVLFITGSNDPLCAVDVVKDFEKSIGQGSKAVIFEGRGHGFAHRPESAEEDTDAEQAFIIMRNWLHNGFAIKNKSS